LELRLDESEREERVVARWAQRRHQGQLDGPAGTTGDGAGAARRPMGRGHSSR
jgi:hypothetical protein